jgi:hypothetical protein
VLGGIRMAKKKKQCNEEHIFRMHDEEGITLIIEVPQSQGVSDEERDTAVYAILEDIVAVPDDWYLEDVVESEDKNG